MTSKRWAWIIAVAIGACSTPQPPQQLMDARKAYNKARSGKAAQLNPADLHTAKVALNEAEASFQDDPESAETFALSYVALRTAQLVEAKANTKAAQGDRDQAERTLEQLQEEEMARTKGELARAREMLSGEREARKAAEEREREAMRKLAEAAALNVKEETRGTVIVLPGNVMFASGKHELTSGAQQKLTLVAGTLAPQAESHEIVVEGHTDSRGSRDFNMTLSQNRAQSVMNFLVSRGVAASSITAVGVGPDRPVADNNTRAGRQQNRRVEIIVKPAEPR